MGLNICILYENFVILHNTYIDKLNCKHTCFCIYINVYITNILIGRFIVYDYVRKFIETFRL
jgi:hypothetical protein